MTEPTRCHYPAGRKYFAHRLIRLLTKTATAQELGPEVAWLLTVVAHQEDAKWYTGAVTFWNEQLMPLCGFRSKGRLVRARQAAIDSGWLHYEAGGRSQPGRYWCLIPPEYDELPDGPCDESDPFQNRTANGPDDNSSSNKIERQTDSKPNGKRSPFYPNQNPSPEGESAIADPLSADLKEFMEALNESGLAQCRKLTDKRKAALKSRLADRDWRSSWREALDRAAKSSFCRGENDRGWKADVDWFLKPDSVTRILEGKYDDQTPRTGQRVATNADDVMERHTAEVLSRKRAEQAEREAAQKGSAK